MRLSLRELDKLPAAAFVLFAGSVGGVLLGSSEFAPNTGPGAVAAFAIRITAGVAVCWLGVRRRQHAVLSTALQLTLIVGLAQMIAFALSVPRAVPADVHLEWRDVAQTELFTQLVLSPIRFVEAAVLVAIGRARPRGGRSRNNQATSASHLDTVI